MAKQILAAKKSTYRLDEKLRQKILQGAVDPAGRLTRCGLRKIEQQRNLFILKYGNPFGT